jgi:hypothetical protein
MSTSSINNLSSYLQSVLSTSLQNAGLTAGTSGNKTTGIDSSSLAIQPDNSQLSPFAQLMSTLQQLQQSNPTQYQQVTQQIATNLQTAAQTATSEGNTTAATQLNQLSTDFTNASQSGQLPNIQDLAQAVGGHHHHHGGHHHAAASNSSSDSSSDSSTSSTASTGTASTSTSSSANLLLSQLQAFQAGGTQSESLNPMSIIFQTLQTAGISTSSS